VITVDPSLGVLEDADIIVGDDKLLDVGRDLESVDAEVVDAAGMIIIPGLINAHIHTWQTGLRGIAGNWTSVDYHKKYSPRAGNGLHR